MFLFYTILFIVLGYCFILALINAIKGDGSHRLPAILFVVWSALLALLTAALTSY